MAVDEKGALWVALGARASVGRFRPDGTLDEQLDVPASFVSSLCFGGSDGRDLFITDPRQPKEDPGAVFLTRSRVAGAPIPPVHIDLDIILVVETRTHPARRAGARRPEPERARRPRRHVPGDDLGLRERRKAAHGRDLQQVAGRGRVRPYGGAADRRCASRPERSSARAGRSLMEVIGLAEALPMRHRDGKLRSLGWTLPPSDASRAAGGAAPRAGEAAHYPRLRRRDRARVPPPSTRAPRRHRPEHLHPGGRGGARAGRLPEIAQPEARRRRSPGTVRSASGGTRRPSTSSSTTYRCTPTRRATARRCPSPARASRCSAPSSWPCSR